MNLKVAVAGLFLITTFSHCSAVNAQVAPTATQDGFTLKVGAGFSDYAGNLNNGQLQGGALWVDFVPPRMPSFLHGFGVEAEARGVTASETAPTQPGALRQSTVGGGPLIHTCTTAGFTLTPSSSRVLPDRVSTWVPGASNLKPKLPMPWAAGSTIVLLAIFGFEAITNINSGLIRSAPPAGISIRTELPWDWHGNSGRGVGIDLNRSSPFAGSSY
jgi:hypothetical protein